jgi:hypothetical protein
LILPGAFSMLPLSASWYFWSVLLPYLIKPILDYQSFTLDLIRISMINYPKSAIFRIFQILL